MSQRLIGIVIGLVLGIVGTLVVGRVRGESAARAPTGTTNVARDESSGAAVANDGSGGADEVAALRVRVAELEATLRGVGSGSGTGAGAGAGGGASDPRRARGPDAEHGMTTDPAWWDAMPRVPAWDGPRQQLVLSRLSKLGIALDAKRVECRKRCCRLTLPGEVYEEHLAEITSSVGLGVAPSGGMGTSGAANDEHLVIQCWSTEPVEGPLPDRAVERAALLARVAGAVKKCGQGVAPAITLELWLSLDEEGQIAKVDSNKAQLGSPAAVCAEAAVLGAAAFAPSAMSTDVPISVVVGGGGS